MAQAGKESVLCNQSLRILFRWHINEKPLTSFTFIMYKSIDSMKTSMFCSGLDTKSTVTIGLLYTNRSVTNYSILLIFNHQDLDFFHAMRNGTKMNWKFEQWWMEHISQVDIKKESQILQCDHGEPCVQWEPSRESHPFTSQELLHRLPAPRTYECTLYPTCFHVVSPWMWQGHRKHD